MECLNISAHLLSDLLSSRGGLSNKLFLCSLPDSLDTVGDEPRSVLLRLYGAILQVGTAFAQDSVSDKQLNVIVQAEPLVRRSVNKGVQSDH